MTQTDPIKVIYDTDPGVDDAMALYFALAHPAIDLVDWINGMTIFEQ